MNLELTLRYLYPDAPAHQLYGKNNPWTIRDDGDGPFIESWNYGKPKPTVEILAAAAPKAESKERREQLEAKIAARRYVAENSGLTLNGISISTTRESQGLFNGAELDAIRDNERIFNWKTKNGFAKLNAATLIELASAVRAHRQVCFDREEQLLRAVEDNSYLDEQLEQGWPS